MKEIKKNTGIVSLMFVFVFIGSFVFLGSVSEAKAASEESFITLISLNGGEKLETSKTYRIKWDSSLNIYKVTI